MAIFGTTKRKKRRKKRRQHVKMTHAPKPKPKPKPVAQARRPLPSRLRRPRTRRRHRRLSPPRRAVDPPAPTQPTAVAATSRERLFLNRFGTGFTQAALAALRAAGTPEAWLEAQLAPASVTGVAKVAQVDDWFSHLRRTPAEKCATDQAKTKAAWEYGNDLGNWSILRRIYSERSGAGDDDRLLVHRAAHPGRPRPRLGLPLRLRHHHPRERARPLRGPAGRVLAAPGDARLPRQLDAR